MKDSTLFPPKAKKGSRSKSRGVSRRGQVTTKEMVVYGTVNGNITTQSLEIKGTGKITGDIETGTLLVEAGGVYNGHLAMQSANTKQIKQSA
ncbi:MAG: polymer-forming cytoskeletal protein [Mucilaginibacter sp.]|nr:polymer-forming cytoskeletal protein [Mucilaginibacter sp.]